MFTPTRLECLRKTCLKSIVCGSFHTIAITDLSNIYVWGRSVDGRLGIGSGKPIYVASPPPIPKNRDGGDEEKVLVPVQIPSRKQICSCEQVAGGIQSQRCCDKGGVIICVGVFKYGAIRIGKFEE